VFETTGLHHFFSGIDLALLSQANHSIMTYGTFGMWGALLAGGQTVLAKSHLVNEPSKDIQKAELTGWEFV